MGGSFAALRMTLQEGALALRSASISRDRAGVGGKLLAVRATFAIATGVLLTGCVHVGMEVMPNVPKGIARARAASELPCPDDQLTVTDLPGSSYKVDGCGKSRVYDCTVSDLDGDGDVDDYTCIPEAPSPVTPSSR